MTSARAKLRWLKKLPVYRFLALPRRALTGLSYIGADLASVGKWLFVSREDTNFTYNLTEDNVLYLASMIAVITGFPLERVQATIRELEDDGELRDFLRSGLRNSAYRAISDAEPRYARRAGWYAIIRLLKPRVVIETGVDKGLGSVVICAALRRNATEGAPGRYYGTDIVPTAGWLLEPPYADYGEILVGDSLESLRKFDQLIDLFINDSDHSADYEREEYEVVKDKLSENAVILGDNSHEVAQLADFARSTGRSFLFFREQPRDHWYRGAGIGFCFKPLAHQAAHE